MNVTELKEEVDAQRWAAAGGSREQCEDTLRSVEVPEIGQVDTKPLPVNVYLEQASSEQQDVMVDKAGEVSDEQFFVCNEGYAVGPVPFDLLLRGCRYGKIPKEAEIYRVRAVDAELGECLTALATLGSWAAETTSTSLVVEGREASGESGAYQSPMGETHKSGERGAWALSCARVRDWRALQLPSRHIVAGLALAIPMVLFILMDRKPVQNQDPVVVPFTESSPVEAHRQVPRLAPELEVDAVTTDAGTEGSMTRMSEPGLCEGKASSTCTASPKAALRVRNTVRQAKPGGGQDHVNSREPSETVPR